MLQVDLGGNDWTLIETSGSRTWPAVVPGCVHTDLLNAGDLPDPWFRDNEKHLNWVWLQDWAYERLLAVDEDLLAADRLLLRCQGLDTHCTIRVNGDVALEADNMHRTWLVDIKPLLKPGDNSLRLEFPCPKAAMDAKEAARPLPSWNLYQHDFRGKSHSRKMACAFGWDWGLMAPSVGIWRSIDLLVGGPRLEHLRIRQEHDGATVRLALTGLVDGQASVCRFSLISDGQVVASREAAGGAESVLTVADAKLWWSNGMGDQPLYTVVAELLDDDGQAIDRIQRTVGLRTCELIREEDEFGESFRFRVNGRDVFMKGANWIPCDVFPSRIEDAVYRQLLLSAAEAGMNMIRVWGGGIYEDERFYDLCDELGILVWQDFMFACSTYPTTDADFMATVEQEAIDNVRRLHHRACLGLWCGNNELEQGLAKGDEWTGSSMPWAEYSLLYDDMLPRIVADEDGITPYWPCSPHSPNGNRDDFNNDRCGDAHAWSVWFGGQPIESQRTWTYRFMSEFGFQSFPEPRTVEAFTDSEDRSLTNWVMDYHQRSAGGNQKIFRTLLDWFPAPKRFDETLWLTQLTQALCIQYAAEHARRLQGRMDGLLYWQLNDLWPGATWSSIDVHGRWKALHFFAARFFAPILVSLEEDHATGTVAVHVSNHRPDDFVGTVHWAVTDCAGTLRAEGSDLVDVASQSDKLVATIACQEIREAGGTERLPLEVRSSNAIPMAGDRDLLVWATVDDGGLELGRNLAFFAKPKYWQLCQPVIQTSVIDGPEGLIVHLECDVCAPWTRLEVPDHDVRFADNFVHVAPGLPIHVPVLESDGLDAVDLEQQLVVTPLIDTWQ